MSTLDPAVRDLLIAIDTAMHAAGLSDYPLAAAHTAIRNTLRYGEPDLEARWLVGEPQVGEVADAKRVRSADRWDLYQATKEQPA